MQKILSFLVISSFVLAGCNDGVPKVDDPSRPVDHQGNAIKGAEFNERFCSGKPTNETCAKVQRATSNNSSLGKMPSGY
jgi:hypothetical protein